MNTGNLHEKEYMVTVNKATTDDFDYSVVKLQRIRIMHMNLKGLSTGQWRVLSGDELSVLFRKLENRSQGQSVA